MLGVAQPERVVGGDGGVEFFEKHIRPALVKYCYECHSIASVEVKGGLRLDSREGIRKGGETGPAVVPGDVESSLLIQAVRRESFEMPPDQRLPDGVIEDFTKWIALGAPDPRDQPPSSEEAAEISWQSILEERRGWWSLQPVRQALPPVEPNDWSDDPIDRFILAKQREAGVEPSGPADARTLIRRLSFVLTGLPPEPSEVEHFVDQYSREPEEAYAELVERLLASPHYGERWARHWMDVVRFAETHGYEWNHEIRDAWRYRDYLIRAFNADVPYDQLVREHIAGDLLEHPRINAELWINESLVGTAFWRFGELGHDDCAAFPEIRFDSLDNQIDTFAKAFQGLTVACARCHDHKLDAISTKDYYALVGILESSRPVVHTLDAGEQIAEQAAALLPVKQKLRERLGELWLRSAEDVSEVIAACVASPGSGGEQRSEAVKALADLLSRQDLDWGNPAHVLKRLAGPGSDSNVRQTWSGLKREYADEQARRAQSNAENFEPWGDFRSTQPDGWYLSGLGLRGGCSPPGDFAVALQGAAVLAAVLPSGVYTHVVSDRFNGSLHSPWLPVTKKHVSVQIVGDGLSMVRTVVDSCALNEFAGGGLEYLSGGAVKWKTFPTSAGGSHRSYVELTTTSDNLRWPDRPDRAGKTETDRSSFGVLRAVLHDGPAPPQPELTHVLLLFEQPEPDDLQGVASAFREVARHAIAAWKDEQATDADVEWINWMLALKLLPHLVAADADVAAILGEYRRVESALPDPRVVAGMIDLGAGVDFPVLRGGDSLNPGPAVQRRYLEVLSTVAQEFRTAGSGRRELAEIVASRDNPLTARIMVNRVWHHVFGRGIVPTADDFGRMGELPTHPELLDSLAAEFVDSGWSIKQLIRSIVSSRTFQQSGATRQQARERDADNRLLHRYPVRRLEAETIRDTILAVSGRLDASLFGPSIHPHRDEEKTYRKLLSGPLDGNGRRSLYIKTTRMEGPKFLELFDLPNPMSTRGQRDNTNVPSQALALMNDPFLVDQARFWAERLVAQNDATIEARVDRMFLKAVGRPLTAPERQRLVEFVEELAPERTAAAVLADQGVWQDVAHAIFNMKELIYLR